MSVYGAGSAVVGALCGSLYAALLFVAAFLVAGSGHGSYLPFAVFGAPLSLTPALRIWGVLAMWPIAGFVLGLPRARVWSALILFVHLAAVMSVLVWGTPDESPAEQWAYFETAHRFSTPAIRVGFAVYVLGQLIAWTVTFVRSDRVDERPQAV